LSGYIYYVTWVGHFFVLNVNFFSINLLRLLHLLLSADSKEVIIRNFVRNFSDSSVSTIWVGKPRLFFIQACRSLCPTNNISVQNNTRAEIKENDLSPKMLVGYSCSPSEESKRNPEYGFVY
jgi:hypothetical protein